MANHELTTLAAKLIGAKGGRARSERKRAACAINGKKGGRPRRDGAKVRYRVEFETHDNYGKFKQWYTSRRIAEKIGVAWRQEMRRVDPTHAASYRYRVVEEPIPTAEVTP